MQTVQPDRIQAVTIAHLLDPVAQVQGRYVALCDSNLTGNFLVASATTPMHAVCPACLEIAKRPAAPTA